jgi:hypothetical protein
MVPPLARERVTESGGEELPTEVTPGITTACALSNDGGVRKQARRVKNARDCITEVAIELMRCTLNLLGSARSSVANW